ncbi:multiple cyclophane-containing RiPP AmcA [Micromonospora haikouensis]|uniref:multiple cyclophane-containing RiPP AmcA n=1 Tax=Micromonospora haikouensis TaxID=686309 RepID=UPI00379E8F9E
MVLRPCRGARPPPRGGGGGGGGARGGGGGGGGGRPRGGGGGGGRRPPPPPPHRTQVADPTGGPAVTVYISRNVEIADLSRDRATTSPPVGAGPADPPLLTHVWRIVFERQAGERDPR